MARSVPVLHVIHEHRDSPSRFIEFVYSFLLFRDVTIPIRTFILKYHAHAENISVNHINVWLNCVTKRDAVEYVDLDCTPYYGPGFPNLRTTCCMSLVVLKLRGFQVTDVSTVQVELPSLKILHLESLDFANDMILPELLSRCPNLEDFKAIHCRYGSLSEDFYSLHYWHGFALDNSNSKKDEWDKWVGFKSLAKLVRAEIDKSNIQISMETLNNVGHLILNIDKVLPYSNQIGTFHNLTNLQLYFGSHEWQWLIEMLHHCPKLQILAVRKEEIPYNNFGEMKETWICPKFAPKCISFKLRECTIYDYKGTKSELQFAMYIMRKARVLGIIRIYSHQKLDPKAKLKMKEKLLLSKKRSATCQVSFDGA